MKKIGLLLLVLPLMVALSSVAFAHTCPDYFKTGLVAGGGNVKSAMLMGDVSVCQGVDCEGGDVLKVHYWAFDGWCITETHLHVATSLEGIPQTKKYNPIPGHFDYAGYHDCVESVTYIIPMEEGWGAGDELVIAAHAVVQKWDDCGNMVREETAWGGWDGCGESLIPVGEFEGRNWATYFTYPVQ